MIYLITYFGMVATTLITPLRGSMRSVLYWAFMIGLFLFVAFRYRVGCDWIGYAFHFWAQQEAGFENALRHSEPLWWIWVELVETTGLSYPWVNVGVAIAFFGDFHMLARRQPDPLGFLTLSFPLLIMNMPMSALRQGAAIGLVCIALTCFVEKKLIRFLIWVVLASLIHNSAAVMLMLAPLVSGTYSRGRLALAALLAAPGFAVMLQSAAGDLALSRYVETNVNAQGGLFRVGTLALTSALYYVALGSAWRRDSSVDYKLASVGALLMIGLLPLTLFSSVIGDRFAYYLMPVQAMMLARIPQLRTGSQVTLLAVAPYFGLGLLLLVWISTSWIFQTCYVPYDTWLLGLGDRPEI